jgi:hypothetical protein
MTITIVNLFNGFATSSAARTVCYPRTLTTFRFPFPPGIPPAAPCPSVAFMPTRMVSISTPDGTAGECADKRDLRAGCGSGGEGKGRPVGWGNLGFGFVLDACPPAVDLAPPVLDFVVFTLGGGAGCGYVYGSLGMLSVFTRCI